MIPRLPMVAMLAVAALASAVLRATPAEAQQLDMSHGGPVEITASNGIEWHQNDQTVIARGNAHAVRGDVTVVADELIAHYRKKATAAGTTPAGTTAVNAPAPAAPESAAPASATPGAADAENGGNEIYRLEAVGTVNIFTPTDLAQGDRAIYDIDQAVLVLTGHNLKLTTPQDVITARDALEYWSQKHMAVARGDAMVVTNDARQINADTLVAYTTEPANQPGAANQPAPAPAAKPAAAVSPGGAPSGAPGTTPGDPLAASGKLQRVEVFGNVVIRTTTQTVRGDRGVYVPDTGIARMAGNARLTQGQNQVNGSGLEVNLQTGIYRLISDPGQRVQGLVVPNDSNTQPGGAPGGPGGTPGSATGTPGNSAQPGAPGANPPGKAPANTNQPGNGPAATAASKGAR
jgi:lipopolysaccharide export system protein LptA